MANLYPDRRPCRKSHARPRTNDCQQWLKWRVESHFDATTTLLTPTMILCADNGKRESKTGTQGDQQPVARIRPRVEEQTQFAIAQGFRQGPTAPRRRHANGAVTVTRPRSSRGYVGRHRCRPWLRGRGRCRSGRRHLANAIPTRTGQSAGVCPYWRTAGFSVSMGSRSVTARQGRAPAAASSAALRSALRSGV